eukprot:5338276-Pleurochrysis_carterae.AAC.2
MYGSKGSPTSAQSGQLLVVAIVEVRSRCRDQRGLYETLSLANARLSIACSQAQASLQSHTV